MSMVKKPFAISCIAIREKFCLAFISMAVLFRDDKDHSTAEPHPMDYVSASVGHRPRLCEN
ncbi:hypothetical protein, partial [Sphingobium sp. TCM1]|uniref:hypothetical protein n=1 Tax=Sphingobium sp. TCM1 TaxID=453246 RepID=UPI001E2BA9CF